MISYQQYNQVLEILKRTESTSIKGFVEEDTIEKKASAICDLFDTKTIAKFGTVTHTGIYDKSTPEITNFNRVTCGCTNKKDCEGYN